MYLKKKDRKKEIMKKEKSQSLRKNHKKIMVKMPKKERNEVKNN